MVDMRYDRHSLDYAKSKIGISQVWRNIGLPGEPKRICRSPFREDRKPSFSISHDDKLWKDFSTNEGGDLVNFVSKALSLNINDSIQWVVDAANGVISTNYSQKNLTYEKTFKHKYHGLNGLELNKPSIGQIIKIAETRNWFTFVGLQIAANRGLLYTSQLVHRGDRLDVWIFTDDSRKSAQARRLDGFVFKNDCGGFKSKSLESDPCHPAGLWDIINNNRRNVIICEGEIDSLAAITLAWLSGKIDSVGVLCLSGVSKGIAPNVCDNLKGRYCRIVRQSDSAGYKAAVYWGKSLINSGVKCDVINLARYKKPNGELVKDIGDLICRPQELEDIEIIAANFLEGIK